MRFALLPVLVGWEKDQPVRVWLGWYEWRYTTPHGGTAEYRPLDFVQNFKPRTWRWDPS
jgi:hypothetical protein